MKGKFMQLNSTSTNPSPSFTAVRFAPKNLKEWNKDILSTALDSHYIQNIIRKNETAGKDTFLRFYDNKPTLNDSIKERTIHFSVSNGDVYQLTAVSNGPCYEGSKICNNIIGQIKKHDYKNHSIEEKLESLKKIASSVIYE